MSNGDCVCCLMFDEMSVRGNLHFNQKFGCIDGFEDLGSHNRTSNIANHALVFIFSMVSIKSGSSFAICVLKMFTLWQGLRFDMLVILRIHNIVHHHLLTLCTYSS